MKLTHQKPCKQCPFLKTSISGYLGDSSPEDFVGTALADVQMPCHCTVDYANPDWAQTLDTDDVSYCAGALVFFSNMCKLSRDRSRPQLERSDSVFQFPAEFIRHHKYGGEGSGT